MTSAWKGEERRVQDHREGTIICKQETAIKDISEAVIRTEGAVQRLDLRINGTLEKMAVHVEDSSYWRRFIVGVAISLVISILGGIVTVFSLSYNLGQYTSQIQVNTERIHSIEVENDRFHKAKSEVTHGLN